MGLLTEASCYDFEFLVGERRTISADNITLANGQNLPAGSVLAKTFVGTGAGANAGGNTGNPTVGAIVVGALGEAGMYKNVFTDATHFQVFSPSGAYLGAGVLGAAFLAAGGRVGYTLTAGGIAAVAGDEFDVTVTEGASTFQAATGPDAVAILGIATNAAAGATQTVAITRLAEFNVNMVNFGTMDAAHKADAIAALARKNLIARTGF